MCSKTCHLTNAPLIRQVKTTAFRALDPVSSLEGEGEGGQEIGQVFLSLTTQEIHGGTFHTGLR